jgi:hypothetical protein
MAVQISYTGSSNDPINENLVCNQEMTFVLETWLKLPLQA